MRKKTVLAVLTLATLILVPTHVSAGTPKAGIACSKAGLIRTTATKKFTCHKSGKKLIWDNGVALPQATTAAPSQTQSAAPSPTPSLPTTNPDLIYVAKDQRILRHLTAAEGCANPNAATAHLQVLVGQNWINVKNINSGWAVTFNACPPEQLGKKDSLAWVEVYMDPGTTYRWVYTGEVNIANHNAQGNGISASVTVPLPRPVIDPHPVEGGYGITWENIASRVQDISAAAYTDAQATIARNAHVPTAADNFTTYWSPGAQSTDPNIQDSITLLKRTFTLYAPFPHPSQVFFVGTTLEEKDQTYAKIDMLSPSNPFMKNSFDNMYGINPNEPAGSVFTNPKCNGSDSLRNTFTWPDLKAAGAILTSFCPTNNPQVHVEAHHGAAHEYAHLIQIQIYNYHNLRAAQPCWMTEGEAEWAQTAVSPDFSSYLSLQHLHPYYLTTLGTDYSVPTNTVWSARELADYFANANKIATCGATSQYALAYSAGAAAVEALVAIGGSEAPFALDQHMANGESLDQAFNAVFHIDWAKAEPILSDVVAQKLTHVNQPDALTYQKRP